MKRYCDIILVVLAVVALAGCRSHRDAVRHEEARRERAIQDSMVVSVDTMSRRDSVSLSWLASGLSLDVDSIDWHFTWDSAGRVAGVSGKRLVSRRSSRAETQNFASLQTSSHEEARYQRAIQDSLSHEAVEDKHVETVSGWRPSWLKMGCMAVLVALAAGGVIHLRELTDRWSKRR